MKHIIFLLLLTIGLMACQPTTQPEPDTTAATSQPITKTAPPILIEVTPDIIHRINIAPSQPFTLPHGDEATWNEHTFTLLEINDQRCPDNADCEFDENTVILQLQHQIDGIPQNNITLTQGQAPALATYNGDGYTLELQAITPGSGMTDAPTPQENYQAQLILQEVDHMTQQTPMPSGPAANSPGVNIEGIKLLLMESFPLQASAHVTGYMPNGCYSVSGTQVVRQGNIFYVNITAVQKGQICTMALVPINETISLDILNLPAGDYAIVSGSMRTNFTLDQDNTAPGSDPINLEEQLEQADTSIGTDAKADAPTTYIVMLHSDALNAEGRTAEGLTLAQLAQQLADQVNGDITYLYEALGGFALTTAESTAPIAAHPAVNIVQKDQPAGLNPPSPNTADQ